MILQVRIYPWLANDTIVETLEPQYCDFEVNVDGLLYPMNLRLENEVLYGIESMEIACASYLNTSKEEVVVRGAVTQVGNKLSVREFIKEKRLFPEDRLKVNVHMEVDGNPELGLKLEDAKNFDMLSQYVVKRAVELCKEDKGQRIWQTVKTLSS